MTREDKRPMNPRDQRPTREFGPMGESRKRERSAADEQGERREPALPEQNRKLGKRHD